MSAASQSGFCRCVRQKQSRNQHRLSDQPGRACRADVEVELFGIGQGARNKKQSLGVQCRPFKVGVAELRRRKNGSEVLSMKPRFTSSRSDISQFQSFPCERCERNARPQNLSPAFA